jgi:hypothetical protein
MSFKFRKKGAQFRSKLLKTLDISPLGLFLPFVSYAVEKKSVNSNGFVSHSSLFFGLGLGFPVLQLGLSLSAYDL